MKNEDILDYIKKDEAIKFDTGKTKLSYVPPEFDEIIQPICEYGAAKYGKDNWKSGFTDNDRVLDAALRHLAAHRKGEYLDPESKLPHIRHAAWNILALSYYLDLEMREASKAS